MISLLSWHIGGIFILVQYTLAINNDVVIVECSQWWMHIATSSYFTGKPLKLKETNIANEHFRLKNHNWREKRPVGY